MDPEMIDDVPTFVFEACCRSVSSRFDRRVAMLLHFYQRFHYEAEQKGVPS